ncbi:TPR end-of-group domain-containing protein [Pelolinea submarina]|uniref:DinB family protein n=1 Tax=Pelolinea submarina TaxID=913107 RepID=A0A347ZP14_9CHLR|nr:DinB family protein [Pelolinea submarina]REG08647.1 DinB family protein [Pelolinea submarina]BBB47045.1 hypothetical protein Pelsub_P0272 [Pelolinea submarina]
MSASEVDLKKKTGEVFAQIRSEIDRFAEGLSAEEKNRAGSLQHWSAQFTLVHLAFWEKHYAAVFEKGLAGQPVPLSGSYLDQLNDGVLYEHLGQPFEEARAEEAAAYNQFLDFFERSVSAQALADPQPLDYLKNFTLLNRMLRSHALHPVHHLSDYYVKNAQAERAGELQNKLSEVLSQLPLWKAEVAYKAASFYALAGWHDQAIAELKRALAEKPELRSQVQADEDFEALRGSAEFEQVTGNS